MWLLTRMENSGQYSLKKKDLLFCSTEEEKTRVLNEYCRPKYRAVIIQFLNKLLLYFSNNFKM